MSTKPWVKAAEEWNNQIKEQKAAENRKVDLNKKIDYLTELLEMLLNIKK